MNSSTPQPLPHATVLKPSKRVTLNPDGSETNEIKFTLHVWSGKMETVIEPFESLEELLLSVQPDHLGQTLERFVQTNPHLAEMVMIIINDVKTYGYTVGNQTILPDQIK